MSIAIWREFVQRGSAAIARLSYVRYPRRPKNGFTSGGFAIFQYHQYCLCTHPATLLILVKILALSPVSTNGLNDLQDFHSALHGVLSEARVQALTLSMTYYK